MSITFKSNIKALKRDLEAYDKKRVKAAEIAVKVEANRLRLELKKELKAGAPGGRPFSPLTQIGRSRRKGKAKNNPPLYRLAVPIRYRTEMNGDHKTIEIGFVDPNKGERLSYSWKRIAKLHQAGARIYVKPDLRKALAEMGGRMKKRKATRSAANAFFLKKSTTHFDVPDRPIIEPFWQAHKREAEQNILLNFHRKMKGERI